MAVLARRRGRRAELFSIGDRPRRGPLEELAKKLGVEDRPHFLKRHEDVPAILARAQIGLLCSRAEGLSNAVNETMAAGLPVVVTDAGGANRELVRHGERGLVVSVGAPRALAEAMAELAASKTLRLRMGAAGRAFVERELGWSGSCAGTMLCTAPCWTALGEVDAEALIEISRKPPSPTLSSPVTSKAHLIYSRVGGSPQLRKRCPHEL